MRYRRLDKPPISYIVMAVITCAEYFNQQSENLYSGQVPRVC